jgi:hypothetical protein
MKFVQKRASKYSIGISPAAAAANGRGLVVCAHCAIAHRAEAPAGFRLGSLLIAGGIFWRWLTKGGFCV